MRAASNHYYHHRAPWRWCPLSAAGAVPAEYPLREGEYNAKTNINGQKYRRRRCGDEEINHNFPPPTIRWQPSCFGGVYNI